MARERGERQALERREQEAKAAGFASFDEMRTFAAEVKKRGGSAQQPPQRPAASPQNGAGGVSRREYESLKTVNSNLEEQVKTLRKENSRLSRRMREEQREHTVSVGTLELHLEAMKAGIKPKLIPAAVALLRAGVPARGENEDEKAYYERLKKFDDAKFFAELKEEHGYLFATAQAGNGAESVAKPPSTGNGARVPQAKAPGATPAPPPDAAEAQSMGPDGKPMPKDARQMTQAQLKQYLRDKGLDESVVDSQ